ncbi:MAG TPA: hypothetical protein VNX86_04490 [Rhizomicrobium sp.]|jgi:hypothetical protein|nr:hypothetical protein [Rhizomicrobium sp.]
MGEDHIRHLLIKRGGRGEAYYWNPSATLRALGLVPEALGTDFPKAKARALTLNTLADEMRRSSRTGDNGPLPGSTALLFAAYEASEEFAALKPRTRHDYSYYLPKIAAEFGHLPATSLTARVIKTYYKRIARERGTTWAYHILGTLRAVLSWAVSEDWLLRNPALDVRIKSPPKRNVVWAPAEAAAYIEAARSLGWHSIAAMAMVFDCIAQSPVDVRTLTARAYDGAAIAVTRAKTGVSDAPIPLWPEVRAALDAYLETRPTLHPDAPLFAHDRTGRPWVESSLHKAHAAVRKAAGLRQALQMQDFRRTAQTEAGAGGATVDEIRALARHSTRQAGEHYVIPDPRFVTSAQDKRLAQRTKTGQKSE